MIADYPPLIHSAAPVIGREVLAYAATALLYPFGRLKKYRPSRRSAGLRTVVLVHGYLANPSCFAPLTAYLRLIGYDSIVTYAYRPGASVDASAMGLKRFLKVNVRGGRMDLICHSLGGLVAMVYLCQLGGARRVDRCITLGTPHYGTYNAYWITGPLGRDLRPDSPFFKRLRAARPLARRVRFTSIVAGSDNIILPRIFASGKSDTVVMPKTGHMSLLFSPKAFRVIAERLARPVKKTLLETPHVPCEYHKPHP